MRRVLGRLIVIVLLLVSPGVRAAAAPADAGGDMSQGNSKARVTVVEYASVACPICGTWFREVYPGFKAKYIDTGKIHFVTREMLVGGDEEVAIASAGFLTARCAGKANYYKVTDAIYFSQPLLYDDPHGVLLRIARTFGLSEAQFNACIADQNAIQALNTRVNGYVQQDHVDGTPTFVINGKALSTGFHPLTDLDAAIAQAQAGK